MVAALLAEMQDGRGSACFEDFETQFRYSKKKKALGRERGGSSVMATRAQICVVESGGVEDKGAGTGLRIQVYDVGRQLLATQ